MKNCPVLLVVLINSLSAFSQDSLKFKNKLDSITPYKSHVLNNSNSYIIIDLPDHKYSGYRGEIIDENDTSRLRILNGIIIKNDYLFNEEFSDESGDIKSLSDKDEITSLGIKTNKSILLIDIKSFSIEYKIDSVLHSRPSFTNTYKYPSYIQLPISIDGKLLPYEDRQRILPKLDLTQIKEINYLNPYESALKYGDITPFGVITLISK